jgi:hypothetical protein
MISQNRRTLRLLYGGRGMRTKEKEKEGGKEKVRESGKENPLQMD